ncbi:MAG: DNA alkylation repair protein, partial [Clostridiaceae bacterium]|nr:DNA alkylation repair protein [Clostridiaceae bacterium]
MNKIELRIQEKLYALQDLKYKEFQCKLMPTISPEAVIGVRTPELRKLAKEISKEPEMKEYLKILPHRYYEENNLHGFLLERMKDYGEAVAAVDEFLPYVDNWATCDSMNPKVFQKHLPELLTNIQKWIAEQHTYTVRFGIGMLMGLYLDNDFSMEFPEWVADIRSEEYYINMMIAWYFATALAKQWDAILPYIEERRLDKWAHNKTIQKAIES